MSEADEKEIFFANFAHQMDKDRNIDIMGIVNLTDDSYFSESRCAGIDAALARIALLLDEGADIIDIGACSTRPGSVPVGEEQEWIRLEPVLREINSTFPGIRVSIDTYWASVVRNAYDLIGDFIVNDISAGEDDPEMLSLVGRLGLKYIAMHKRGDSLTMQGMTDYQDVTAEVAGYFRDFARIAAEKGISDWVLDPGFGFAKNIDQNYTLLRELSRLKEILSADGISPDILVGVSRKSMIYKHFNILPQDSLPATQVLHLAALQNGADILRVHDVAETVRTVALYKLLS